MPLLPVAMQWLLVGERAKRKEILLLVVMHLLLVAMHLLLGPVSASH